MIVIGEANCCVKTFENEVDIRPELTGKSTQFGSLDEIVTLSKEIDGVHPCIDWSHMHARDGQCNTAVDFQSAIDKISLILGKQELRQLHMHISGIDYGKKGEKKHLNLEESDMNYRDLLKVLKDNEICGILVCESPSLEDDALLLKDYYEKL